MPQINKAKCYYLEGLTDRIPQINNAKCYYFEGLTDRGIEKKKEEKSLF